MSTYKQAPVDQSQPEIRKWIVDFTDDLPGGVTVSSAVATHTPPSGSAQSLSPTTATPLVSVSLGPVTVSGVHYVLVTATLSDGQKATCTIAVPVEPALAQPRAGMLNVINRLRQMSDAGPVDYVIAGVAYWSDLVLQSILDRHRSSHRRVELSVEAEYVAGAQEYHDYYTDLGDIEEAGSGTAAFVIEDGDGDAVTPNSYNYDAGHFRFTTDTNGATYYLTCRTFNMEAAAAEVWEAKAAHAAKGYDFSADDAKFDRSQYYDHCVKMAAKYRGLAGVVVSTFFRSDVEDE